MDHRSLSAAEKMENRRGRYQRDIQRQARRRRSALLTSVAIVAGPELWGVLDLLSPANSLDLLAGHLNRARSVAKILSRRLRLPSPGEHAEIALPRELAPRPKRTLLLSNRSMVLPWLAGEEQLDGGKTLEDALNDARHFAEEGASTETIIDKFASSSQLPMHTALRALRGAGLVRSEFTSEEVAAVGRARHFWHVYSEGRRTYRGALLAGEAAAFLGDWAFIGHHNLVALLPGIRLPKNLRRPEYLVHFRRDSACCCLDIHSFPSNLPLIRHPFEPQNRQVTFPKSPCAAE